MRNNAARSKCDFCDKEAVHFCSQATAQSCFDHVREANSIEQAYYEEIEKYVIPEES